MAAREAVVRETLPSFRLEAVVFLTNRTGFAARLFADDLDGRDFDVAICLLCLNASFHCHSSAQRFAGAHSGFEDCLGSPPRPP